MGNRTVITTEDKQVGVYLHWCGEPESVQAFLDVCNYFEFRKPEEDSYGFARLCQVIANYFFDGLSVGVGVFENTDYDNADNGYYIIKNWKIIKQVYRNNVIDNPVINKKSGAYLSIYNSCKERMLLIN